MLLFTGQNLLRIYPAFTFMDCAKHTKKSKKSAQSVQSSRRDMFYYQQVPAERFGGWSGLDFFRTRTFSSAQPIARIYRIFDDGVCQETSRMGFVRFERFVFKKNQIRVQSAQSVSSSRSGMFFNQQVPAERLKGLNGFF